MTFIALVNYSEKPQETNEQHSVGIEEGNIVLINTVVNPSPYYLSFFHFKFFSKLFNLLSNKIDTVKTMYFSREKYCR